MNARQFYFKKLLVCRQSEMYPNGKHKTNGNKQPLELSSLKPLPSSIPSWRLKRPSSKPPAAVSRQNLGKGTTPVLPM